jgi:26S proteasome non-ATPase regulatory subunit 10
LHRAASTGRIEIITLLINNLTDKTDIEAKNKVGQTPLIVACEAGFDQAVLCLARAGADSDAMDSEGNGVQTLQPKLVPVLRSIKQGDM